MRIWRISNYADLSGQGGLLASGRWHTRGTPVVYAADHPSTALIEYLAHVDPEDLPSDFQLLEIDVPDAVAAHAPSLPPNWKTNMDLTAKIGAAFIAGRSGPVMRVPSALVPFAENFVLNPVLLKAAGITILGATRHPMDERLFVGI